MSDQSTSTRVELPSFEVRDVPDFPFYRVSDNGVVLSCRTRGGRLLGFWQPMTPHDTRGDGRLYIGLRKDGRLYTIAVHRLVLLAFVGPCPDGMEACHENGDYTNNHFSNLRWGTHTSNMQDKRRHGTAPIGVKNPAAKLTPDQVNEVKRRCSNGEYQYAVAADLGISQTHVSRIVRGESWRENA